MASVIVFALLRLVPGDLAVVIAGTEVTPERLAEIRADLGLDRPLLTQYFEWMGGVLTGDFGTLGADRLDGHQPARREADGHRAAGHRLDDPRPRLRRATRRVCGDAPHARPTGSGLSAIGQLGIAVPQFLVAMILIALFAGYWGLPSQGFPRQGWDDFGRAARSLVLPTLTLAAAQGAILLRFVRSATLDVLNQDYMRTARAKGLTRVEALFAHGLRNAAIPVVSVVGVQLATLLAGVVVIESVFNLPGVGQMLLRDIGNRDFDKVQGTVLLIAVVVLVIGFLVDVAHYLIDPRLRDGAR